MNPVEFRDFTSTTNAFYLMKTLQGILTVGSRDVREVNAVQLSVHADKQGKLVKLMLSKEFVVVRESKRNYLQILSKVSRIFNEIDTFDTFR